MIGVCNFSAKIEIQIRWRMPTGIHLLQLFENTEHSIKGLDRKYRNLKKL